jgi:hypothetical protein
MPGVMDFFILSGQGGEAGRAPFLQLFRLPFP